MSSNPQEIGAEDSRPPEHRVHIGPADVYDLQSSGQFNLLTYLGLREHHYLLDIGCGSLRAGRLLMPYLQPGHYFGIEPEEWLVNEGIDKEVGRDLVELKRPSFSWNGDFELAVFGQKFDFLLAQSIFSHTSESQIRKCFAEAKEVMKPEAIFAATFFQGEKNYTGDKWTVKATFTVPKMKELAAEARLNCELLDWPHVDLQTWALITHADYALKLPEKTGASRILQLEEENQNLKRLLATLRNSRWSRIGRKLHVFQTGAEFKGRELLRALRR
jgi:SAM-dependent methyltransferase